MGRGEKVTRFSLVMGIWASYFIMMWIGFEVESALRDTDPTEKAQERVVSIEYRHVNQHSYPWAR